MEENKFENQVQQKMRELEIQPSDAVWKKIELQIEKKKSRKWGLIILFLLIGTLLSGGYWLWNAKQQDLSGIHTSIKSTPLKNTAQAPASENQTVQPKAYSVPVPFNQKNNEAADVARKNDKNRSAAQHYKLLNNSKANPKTNPGEKPSIAYFKEKNVITNIKEKRKSEIISGQSSEEQVENNKHKEPGDSIHEKANIDSLLRTSVENEVTKNTDTSNKKQTNTAITKQSNKNKWKLGILLSGGISGVGNNFLALNNSLPAAYSTSVNQGPPSSSQLFPSLIKSGFGFMAGVFAERSISQKTKLISGINFKSFNTSIKLYDSSGTYSARSGANNYSNHFNFIEVPASIKIQIGKGKNIPLVWQGGFVVSELISSNALQINPYTGYYYYHDNSIFNKTQIGFNTALFVSLFSKQKTSILIGPDFYYDASKIANEGLYNKKHFVFTGLHTEIIFGK